MKNFFAAVIFVLSGILPLSGEVLYDASGRPVRYAGICNSSPVKVIDCTPRRDEFRGIWVAVVENIDFPKHKNAAAFQQSFRTVVRNIRNAGFTALIFQIRANCDAFYPSAYAPWSRWLSGKEGVGLGGFDPLRFMVDECHRAGLEFHAWFNPYRVAGKTSVPVKKYLSSLAPGNFARRNPGCVLVKKHPDGNQLFLDPGMPQVVEHITQVVREVLEKYPVDAIHFDDYFYPYEKLDKEDIQTFRRFNPQKLSLDNWRRSNTEKLILQVKLTITRHNILRKRNVRFGVSPFGIWGNRQSTSAGSLTKGKESFFTLFADTRKWVKLHYVDYIVPQIYWPFDHDVAAYAALTDWWCSVVQGTKVKLYIGIGAYNGGKWQIDELKNQVRYNRMRRQVSGSAFFSYRSFFGKERNRGALRLLEFFRQTLQKGR